MAENRPRFEYRVLRLKPGFLKGLVNDETLQGALNQAGRDGWELVPINVGGIASLLNSGILLIFKRPH